MDIIDQIALYKEYGTCGWDVRQPGVNPGSPAWKPDLIIHNL